MSAQEPGDGIAESSPGSARFDGGGAERYPSSVLLRALALVLLVTSACSSSPGVTPADANDAGGTTPRVIPTAKPRCPELADAKVWDAVAGAFTVPSDLGKIVACAHVDTLGPDALKATGYFGTWTPQASVERYVIQYLSQAPAGQARLTTAVLYLPVGSSATAMPLVAVNHGTSGVAPGCGPSHALAITDYMALPLAGRGYPVVAPDYFGMGIADGFSPYLIGEAEAYSALDGLRALKAFREERFDEKVLGSQVFLMGHSQGGHAALFAHQLYDPTLGLELLGSIGFAPGLGSAKGMGLPLSQGTRTTDSLSLFTAMTLYAHMEFYGEVQASSWLTPAAASQLPGMFASQCLTELYFRFPGAFPTHADLFTAKFRADAATCAFDGSPCPAFEPWSSWIAATTAGNIKSPAPVLLLHGSQDTTVLPGSTTCIANRLKANGTAYNACAYAASHLSVVEKSMPDVLAWMDGRRRGELPDVCNNPLQAPCP
jgi:pimeloyl-ACP methyl ester carboxylesterase